MNLINKKVVGSTTVVSNKQNSLTVLDVKETSPLSLYEANKETLKIKKLQQKANSSAKAIYKNRKYSESLKDSIKELLSSDDLIFNDILRSANINRFCN